MLLNFIDSWSLDIELSLLGLSIILSNRKLKAASFHIFSTATIDLPSIKRFYLDMLSLVSKIGLDWKYQGDVYGFPLSTPLAYAD